MQEGFYKKNHEQLSTASFPLLRETRILGPVQTQPPTAAHAF